MNNNQELTRALTIVQNKLNACHAQKTDVLNKMSTKRTLLHESRQTLQYQYASAFSQQKDQKRSRLNKKPLENHLVSIIGQTNETTLVEPDIHEFNLMNCQGWNRGRRIWIQAEILCTELNCIVVDQVHLQCLPNLYKPDTVYFNIHSKLEKDQEVIPLFYTFDLLPDISFHQLQAELKMYCVYNQYSSSNTCQVVDWKLADDDISWTKQLSILNHHVIQAYFPLHLRIMTDKDPMNIIDVPCMKRDRLIIANDQSFIMILSTQEDYIDLYGLDSIRISYIASFFDEINLKINHTSQLIQCLGDEYVTLEHSKLNKTRVNIATLLSLL